MTSPTWLQTVDVGNSSIGVVGWSAEGRPGTLQRLADPSDAAGVISAERVRLLSVAAGRCDALLTALDATTRRRCEVLQGVPLPLGDERLAHTAGRDRLALALAALPGPAVVVDGGTALTVELVDEAGVYRGGFIAPGPGSALRGLTGSAPALPDTGGAPVPITPGRETRGALSAGAWGMAVGGTDRLVLAALAELGAAAASARVFATGGWGSGWARDTGLELGERLCVDEVFVHRGIRAWPTGSGAP